MEPTLYNSKLDPLLVEKQQNMPRGTLPSRQMIDGLVELATRKVNTSAKETMTSCR